MSPTQNWPNKEQLLALWMKHSPSAKSPYALYGNPPMWQTLVEGDLVLFTRPGRTMTRPSAWAPYTEVDGVHYQWQRDGEWVGQGCQATFESFEARGPAKTDIRPARAPQEPSTIDVPAVRGG